MNALTMFSSTDDNIMDSETDIESVVIVKVVIIIGEISMLAPITPVRAAMGFASESVK